MRDEFARWIVTTSLSRFVNGYPWVWPACETLHFIGLCFLMGGVGMVDLRMLGVAKNLPFAPLHRLLRWGIFGFAINLITGIFFIAGNPKQYMHNYAFGWKVAFILLAGINVIVFYLTVFRETEALGPGEDAPLGAKIVAAVSLFLWVGVMYWGRMLPFLGNSF
jgi:hypothetical protein